MSKRIKLLKKILCLSLFLIFTFCIFIYLLSDIYNFQDGKKFSGDYLFNPYSSDDSMWLKANFHAHSIAWAGTTNGAQNPDEVLNIYKNAGYDFAALSNYESIATQDTGINSLNVYEHGYNIFKTHQLALLPRKVCYTDLPLIQCCSNKQYVIKMLNDNSAAVVLAHPTIRNGYTDNDLKKLSGYNLVEVLNHSVNSSPKWDTILSSGKPVWIVGDDDTHDATDSSQTFKNWTMVGCNQHDKDSLIKNLSKGDAYGVSSSDAKNYNLLKKVIVNDMHLQVSFAQPADSIVLIGQDGITKSKKENVDNIDYDFLPGDSYIRTVAYTKGSSIYLNPILRYDGKSNPENIITASVNIWLTFLYRFVLISVWTLVLLYLYGKNFNKLLKSIKYKSYRNEESASYSI